MEESFTQNLFVVTSLHNDILNCVDAWRLIFALVIQGMPTILQNNFQVKRVKNLRFIRFENWYPVWAMFMLTKNEYRQLDIITSQNKSKNTNDFFRLNISLSFWKNILSTSNVFTFLLVYLTIYIRSDKHQTYLVFRIKSLSTFREFKNIDNLNLMGLIGSHL